MCRLCVTLVCAVMSDVAVEKPVSLVRNGGFDGADAWSIGAGSLTKSEKSGQCLQFDRAGGARQDVLVARRELTLTAAVDIKARNVVPEKGKPGYAFAAVYQTDETGRLVAVFDFVQLDGTRDWQRHSHTFQVHPDADFVSLR